MKKLNKNTETGYQIYEITSSPIKRSIAAARAQYVLSFVVERGTCLKYKD